MAIRNAVSSEAIARAIKARIVVERGIDDPWLGLPLDVRPLAPDSDGCNWRVVVDAPLADDTIRTHISAAAAEVSNAFMLNSQGARSGRAMGPINTALAMLVDLNPNGSERNDEGTCNPGNRIGALVGKGYRV